MACASESILCAWRDGEAEDYLRLAREDESADKMLNRIKGTFFRKGGKKNHEN